MNIVILGCGKIAHRVAIGIKHSKGVLYGIASRDKKRAESFALQYDIEHIYNYEECLNDPNVDLIYIATANPTHYDLIKTSLLHHKHVICEKPMVASLKEVEELFELAHSQNRFLMEAHKTCFIAIQKEVLKRVHEIGKILEIEASFCRKFNEDDLSDWSKEKEMGGSFYDIGVYPLVFALAYSQSEVKTSTFDCQPYKDYPCEFECHCKLEFENGIIANLYSSWLNDRENLGIIKGEKGTITIKEFWKTTTAKINDEVIEATQNSDFTGQIDHAIDCISNGSIQSEIMSAKMSKTIAHLCEEMKKTRDN